MPDALRSFVTQETVIASLANAIIPSLFLAFLSAGYPVGIWGGDGLVASVAKPTVGVAIGMTLVLTLVIRKRIQTGHIKRDIVLAARPDWLRWVPANLVMRTVALAALAVAVIMPLVIVAAHSLGIQSYHRGPFVAFNFVHGLALGLLLAPLIALAAVRDADDKNNFGKED